SLIRASVARRIPFRQPTACGLYPSSRRSRDRRDSARPSRFERRPRRRAGRVAGLLNEERKAIARNPDRQAVILREVLRRAGIDPTAAEAICRQASRDPERALGIYSRAVLGVNPSELGSPWASALSSLVTFATGAFVPLAPWLVATGPKVAPISFVLGLGAAAAIGGALGWQKRPHVL